ncbi:sodium:proton antiporter [Pseudomonas brassicacearum]|uniref:Sodium:proton antiporter n=1 Tax=Pseudomonas brassicacearum TaxID=930166 RepID=A0A423GIU6_9PSED|nr:cation:proton antiporter [Pseudomonas brassicacearum]ROM89660.1 sodium:proton antiporter [Pseudomonas brassicacearum]
MSIALWSLLIGILLITMVLAGTLLARLLLSSAMVYLVVGFALGPAGLGIIRLDPARHADILQWAAEVALLISLFAVGLRMGAVPLFDRRWLLPLRLAFISMAITVGLITIVGVWGLGLSLGGAVLLGGILAPTDPVLASGVQSKLSADPERLRFSLSGEGGLNDGTAFPFVMLGLGLLGLPELEGDGWSWWLVDALWATFGGLLIGGLLGTLIGKLVVRLRTRYHLAVGLDEFLSLGLVAVAYGAAQLCLASGFLAVFATGLALQHVKEQPRVGTASLGTAPRLSGHSSAELATHSHHASEAMSHAVESFNGRLESLAELALVLLVGAMLSYTEPWLALWWFIPLLFVLLRGLAVTLGTFGEPMPLRQRGMLIWFGIRGIGSIFYLMFALHNGVTGALAQQLITLTLATVAVSIVLHGVSVRPLMKWYRSRKARAV